MGSCVNREHQHSASCGIYYHLRLCDSDTHTIPNRTHNILFDQHIRSHSMASTVMPCQAYNTMRIIKKSWLWVLRCVPLQAKVPTDGRVVGQFGAHPRQPTAASQERGSPGGSTGVRRDGPRSPAPDIQWQRTAAQRGGYWHEDADPDPVNRSHHTHAEDACTGHTSAHCHRASRGVRGPSALPGLHYSRDTRLS